MFQPLTFESCFQFPADDAAGCGVQGVRERARVFETLIFFKRPDVAVLCAFSGNTIACSYSMSATGVPSKALKVDFSGFMVISTRITLFLVHPVYTGTFSKDVFSQGAVK